MEEEKEKKGFKVLDRRRFDSIGNEREEDRASATPSKPTVGQPVPQSERKPMNSAKPTAPEANSGDESINFSSFVMSLATQALMQLGEMQPPPGVEIQVDKEAARQSIDILRMLEKKTAGNLDESEAKMLEEILHALKVSFVKNKA
jgi:hypothetical protein